MRGEATRQQIKDTALRLFATRGLDGVSIREIVDAAGQRNAGSINYYFKSKDELVRELIRDVATMLDNDHIRRLEETEASGGPHSIREIVSILITYPTMDAPGEHKDEFALRFLNMIMINHRDLMFEVTNGVIDTGTRRCVAHMRRFAVGLPPVLLQQRLRLVMLYLFAAASSREASVNQKGSASNLWSHPATRDNLMDTVEGILLQPSSPATLSLLDAANPT